MPVQVFSQAPDVVPDLRPGDAGFGNVPSLLSLLALLVTVQCDETAGVEDGLHALQLSRRSLLNKHFALPVQEAPRFERPDYRGQVSLCTDPPDAAGRRSVFRFHKVRERPGHAEFSLATSELGGRMRDGEFI